MPRGLVRCGGASHPMPYRTIINHMNTALLHSTSSHHNKTHHFTSPHLTSHHNTSSNVITILSRHTRIISRHVTLPLVSSHHIEPTQRNVISYSSHHTRITSRHVTSRHARHVTSHHITSHHITSTQRNVTQLICHTIQTPYHNKSLHIRSHDNDTA